MPYITPPDVPEERDCRALLIPLSTDWLAIFGGALTELTKTWNWEQTSGISVDDAIQEVYGILQGFYDGCIESGCQQPGGYAPLRVNENGIVEQLINGEWVAPEGVNAYPPIPSRSEPTADERRCAAAANAARVLQELYEQVSEVAQYDLGVAELIVRLVDGLLVYFFWIAPILNGILLMAIGILELLLRGAQYITADVWDTTFDDLIRCYLYECASDDGDVVTFDYDCLMGKLYAANVTPPWSEQRARLAAQIALLIGVVGGVDSLNQMGSVDAVEDPDCSMCEGESCTREIHFDDPSLYSFVARIPGITATLDTGFGHPAPSARAGAGLDVTIPAFSCDVITDLGTPQNVANVIFEYYYNRSDNEGIYLYVQYFDNAGAPITIYSQSLSMAAAPYDEWHTFEDTIGCAGARYVMFGFGGENVGLTAEGWLDTVCINY